MLWFIWRYLCDKISKQSYVLSRFLLHFPAPLIAIVFSFGAILVGRKEIQTILGLAQKQQRRGGVGRTL